MSHLEQVETGACFRGSFPIRCDLQGGRSALAGACGCVLKDFLICKVRREKVRAGFSFAAISFLTFLLIFIFLDFLVTVPHTVMIYLPH